MVAVGPRNDERLLRVAGLCLSSPSELQRRVDGLRTRLGKKDLAVGHRRPIGDLGGECLGKVVGEGIEDVVGVDGVELRLDGLGDLGMPVADVAVPERPHGVEDLATVLEGEHGTLSGHDVEEVLGVLGRWGERMQQAAHGRSMPLLDRR